MCKCADLEMCEYADAQILNVKMAVIFLFVRLSYLHILVSAYPGIRTSAHPRICTSNYLLHLVPIPFGGAAGNQFGDETCQEQLRA